LTADPEANETEPEAPELEVPLENRMVPLTPEVPAFADKADTPPLDEAKPRPLWSTRLPPVAGYESPAFIEKSPPITEELPESNKMEPPLPPAARPVEIEIKPVEPPLEVPVLNSKFPLTPAAPALGVVMVTLPLEVASPDPLERCRAPP
jgi:hypothetical protein